MNITAKRVRKLREQCNLSQRELAEMVGVRQAMISHIEKGLKRPSFPLAVRLASALSVSVEDLVSRDSADESEPIHA